MKQIFACLALLLLANPALATPPRVTTSEDRLVAATQSHVYVLRDIYDNLGSHYAALHDQHLIEIEIATGQASRSWPLRRMRIDTLTADDLLVPGAVTERPGDTDDMMAILRGVGAAPLLPNPYASAEFALVDGAIMKGDEQIATPFALRAAGRAQLGILRDAYPPLESQEDYNAGTQIDFYGLYAEGPWHCDMRADGITLFRPGERVTLTKLACEDEEFSGLWSFHFIVKEPQ